MKPWRWHWHWHWHWHDPIAMVVLGGAADPGKLMRTGHYLQALRAIDHQLPGYRELASRRPGLYQDMVADLLVQRSQALYHAFRDAEALPPAEEAVAILRELSAAKPARFSAYLALALENLSDRLRALGRADEALAAAQEAGQIRGRTRRDAPDPSQAE